MPVVGGVVAIVVAVMDPKVRGRRTCLEHFSKPSLFYRHTDPSWGTAAAAKSGEPCTG
jgi:hypothetical protein